MFRSLRKAISNAGRSSESSADGGLKPLAVIGLSLLLSCTSVLAQGDYEKGISYYKQNQFSKAIAEFEPIVADAPDYEFGHRILGLSYLKTKQYEKAIAAFQNALRLKSDNFTSYMGLALAYFNSRRFGDVLPTLDKGEAYAKTPQDRYQLNHTRGAAAFNRKEWKIAAASLEQAVSLQRGNPEDVLQLGIAYFQLGQNAQARQYLEQAAAQSQGEAQRFLDALDHRQGVEFIEKGEYQKAAEVLSKFVKANPDDGQGWFNLGLAYLFTGNYAASKEAFQRNLRLNPENGASWERLGFLYEKQKQYPQALEAYQKAYRLSRREEAKQGVDRIQKRIAQGQ